MKPYLVLPVLIFLIASILPFSADAALFKAGDTVTIPKDEVVSENAYVAGGQVTISTSVLRDIVIAGGKIIINGQVWGDALLAGGSVDVLELVQGDVRAAGGQVTVAHAVNGDAVLAGGAVSVLPGAIVAGDVVIAGGDVVMDGIVNGTVRIYGGNVRINGTVKGPLYVKAGESLSFGPKAIIEEMVDYRAPEEATVADGAEMPENVTFTLTEIPKEEMKENFAKVAFAVIGALFIIKLVAMAVGVLLAVAFFNTFAKRVAEETLQKFWHMVFIGFLTTVAAPVGIVILIVSVLGMYVGFIAGVLYLLAMLIAGLLMCVAAGALLSKIFKKEIIVNWKWALLGTVVTFVASFIPFVGWLAICLFYLAALGSAVTNLYRDAKAKMS
ncbi:FapA family protein [Patescibacteria group bacterium]|nr:FapA family protein [Patescibacteria group bacterium]